MGYFETGTAGMDYEDRYCMRCRFYERHGKGCPIWQVHLQWNYDQKKGGVIAAILGTFIPRGETRGENLRCTMFTPKGKTDA